MLLGGREMERKRENVEEANVQGRVMAGGGMGRPSVLLCSEEHPGSFLSSGFRVSKMRLTVPTSQGGCEAPKNNLGVTHQPCYELSTPLPLRGTPQGYLLTS